MAKDKADNFIWIVLPLLHLSEVQKYSDLEYELLPVHVAVLQVGPQDLETVVTPLFLVTDLPQAVLVLP